MSKKSVLAAIFLIFIGILFGAVLVSSFKGGVELGFAGDQTVKLGAPGKIHTSFDSKAVGKAFVEVAKAVTPTVVSITVTMKGKGSAEDFKDFFHFFGPDFKFQEPAPEQAGGSGVIINPQGYILTNNHVVDEAEENSVEVVLNDTRRLRAKIVGTDPTTDIAVIKVDASDLPTAAFGDSDSLDVGEWVLAVGNPLGLQSTVTAGIVSAVGRSIGIIGTEKGYGIENFIQTDAAINPGNSGGPLVNLSGEVIGINSAIATTNGRYQGYGFAIPINLARVVAADIIKYGKVRRGYIGVQIMAVDETTAKSVGLSKAEGVFVQRVDKGGAGEAAGVKEGDVILSVDGKEVNKPNELQSYVARKHPGDDVVLRIYRDGKTIEKTVTLKSHGAEDVAEKTQQENKDNTSAESETSAKTFTFDNLGMTVQTLTAEQKEEYDVHYGILVADVKPYGEAFNRGIEKGDIILEIDKKEVSSPKALRSVLDGHKAEDAVLLRIKKINQGGQTMFVAVQIPK